MQSDLSTDVSEMQAQLQLAESHLDQLDPHQQQESLQAINVRLNFNLLHFFKHISILFHFQKIESSLGEMGPKMLDLDQRVGLLLSTEDTEVDSLRATVAALRTRHAILESQCCRYKNKLEVFCYYFGFKSF